MIWNRRYHHAILNFAYFIHTNNILAHSHIYFKNVPRRPSFAQTALFHWNHCVCNCSTYRCCACFLTWSMAEFFLPFSSLFSLCYDKRFNMNWGQTVWYKLQKGCVVVGKWNTFVVSKIPKRLTTEMDVIDVGEWYLSLRYVLEGYLSFLLHHWLMWKKCIYNDHMRFKWSILFQTYNGFVLLILNSWNAAWASAYDLMLYDYRFPCVIKGRCMVCKDAVYQDMKFHCSWLFIIRFTMVTHFSFFISGAFNIKNQDVVAISVPTNLY